MVYPPDSFPALEFGAAPLHPSQLYNALFGLALFAVLWATRRRFTTPGVLFWTFLVAFALGRIVLDGWRAYEPGALLLSLGGVEITESQVMSAAMALFGVLMIARRRRASSPTAMASLPETPPPSGAG